MANNVVKAKSFMEFWNEVPFIIKLAIYITIAVCLYLLGRKLYLMQKQKEKKKLIEGNVTPITYTGASGAIISTNVDVGAKAVQAHDAIWDQFWGNEDEAAAMSAVMSTPNELIKELSELYFKLPGSHILKEDLIKYCEDEWPSMASKFT